MVVSSLVLSCSSNIKNYGYIPSKSDLDLLVVGKDNLRSVDQKIGLPTTYGLEGSYYYIKSTFNDPGLRPAKLIDRKVVVVSFDKNSLLKNIETFGIDDGSFVRLDYRITETGLQNQSLLKQIFNSIGGPSASNLGL